MFPHPIFLKGNTFYDQDMMRLLDGLKKYVTQDMNLAQVAQQIGAIGALLYLSVKAFSIIAGEQKFEIMSLFRPFIIALCILNFSTVLRILELPSRAIEKNLSTAVIASSELIEKKILVKDSLHNIMFDRMIEITNQENKDGRGIFASAASAVGMETIAAIADVSANITVYEKLFFAKISIWLQTFIIKVLLGVFKGLFYAIFFLQLVLMAILAWLGPLSFGFSVMGPWKDSWSHWAGKYISVSLYSAIAYLIMAVALSILSYGISQENARMAAIIQTTKGGSTQKIEAFIAYVLNTDNFLGYLLVAVFATIAGIISIPVVSSWIINTTGTGGAIFNSGLKTAGAVGGTATTAATAGVAGVPAAAGAAMAASKTA